MASSSVSGLTTEGSASAASVSSEPLPIFDAFLDLPHPAASNAVNEKRKIIAPPQGEAFNRSKDVGMELATDQGIARVASFCFPEFREDIYAQEKAKKSNESPSPNSPNLNRYDVYAHDYFASTRGPGPEMAYHTFAMQLSTGQRVYGHVRRYAPHHPVAKSRIDVGRRGIRAMVILTRAAGGENFYNSLLKTIEVLQSHRLTVPEEMQMKARPQQAFLHAIYEEHTKLSAAQAHGSRPSSASSSRSLTFQSLTISLKQIELGNNRFQHVDYSRFVVPPSLVLPYDPTQITTSPILPLLRCLGISNTLRLFSALMCERRIILVSQSTSRLSACASAAISILAQGLLQWQHIYIPILPPSMMNYLAAPMPYLMGVLANHAANIEHISGLGEVLVVYLDQNDLKTHNMPRPDLTVPDILTDMDEYQQQQQRYSSIADILKMDLLNVMKTDRKQMIGENSSGPAVAAKSKDLLKRGFGKLKKVAKKQIVKNKTQNYSTNGYPRGSDPPGIGEYEDDEEDLKQIYAYTEGFNNHIAEEEAGIAFTTFFLCLIGDMRTYLNPPQNGQPPAFNKELFVESRRRSGDGQNSPLYPMLMHFKESQIFEMFVKARVAEIQARKQPPQHAALFSRAVFYHNMKRVPFAENEIRNVLAQISRQNPDKNLIQASAHLRRRAMALTSNSRPEHLAMSEIGKIAQDCRESAFFLVQVMSVIWERIRDSKGMQWKHGFYALQVLMELLLHGPLVVIAEATDGIDKIRKLKFYENMRQAAAQDMRVLATSVYNLLVNRARLFAMRRVCALRRMEGGSSNRRLPTANRNLRIRMKFNVMHALVKPGSGAVSPAPSGDLLGGGFPASPSPSQQSQQQQQPKSYSNDLLSMGFAVQPPTSPSSPTTSNQKDLTQMMGGAAISSPTSQTNPPMPLSSPQAPQPSPTFAQIPPSLSPTSSTPSQSNYNVSNFAPMQQSSSHNPLLNSGVMQQQPPHPSQQLQPAINAQSQPSMTNITTNTKARSQFDPFG